MELYVDIVKLVARDLTIEPCGTGIIWSSGMNYYQKGPLSETSKTKNKLGKLGALVHR